VLCSSTKRVVKPRDNSCSRVSSAFKVSSAAQRLSDSNCCRPPNVLLLTAAFSHLTGGVLFGFATLEGKGISLLLQLDSPVSRRARLPSNHGQPGWASTAANRHWLFGGGLNNLALQSSDTSKQFLMLFLHQGRALRLAGSTAGRPVLNAIESDDQTTHSGALIAFDL